MTNPQILHIGIDDTDSTRQGCTTYVAALLVEKLEKLGVKFLDYPNLIRLNPNVPWKTRGNGALCLRISHADELEEKIKEVTLSLVEEHSDLSFKGTDPGIVFITQRGVPAELKAFAKSAITGIVTLKEALKLVKKFEGEAVGFNTCRGIIGALAAVGETLEADHTYELIAYRTAKNYGLKRKVDVRSIFEMDKLTRPYTFNNVDWERGRVIITPRGPDPILFGIRGETPEVVKKAFALVKSMEPVERWVIFRTNQGTDAHLKRVVTLSQIEPYSSVIVRGTVSRNPKVVPLRHVIFSIKDETGEVDCAAYEPTGALRKIARELIEGDIVEVYGAVRKPSAGKRLTINLEKINILSLVPKIILQNPLCPRCGKRLKSMGKSKGFRCEKCKTRLNDANKVQVVEERRLNIGLYATATRSQRHLTKPLSRYGLEKQNAAQITLIENWHS
ncbi:MAG: tRNA(Ile)(2)-agmatinylcytidine synthase [Candidatus Bathyarchaeota archaeon]|nr:tRNA(Ile)(2)-agmatinylcytidine synthase [Candidatus Bathyarchaeota archaeon]